MRDKIENHIKQYVQQYPQIKNVQTKWQEPLVAFADAEDPMFAQLKQLISPSHALPKDFLPSAKTVVAYFIPFAENIVKENIAGREAAKSWAIAYIETNQLIFDLNTFMQNELSQANYNSTIIPATHNFDKQKLISDWSHRHVAYIAGLGTFGLNNMLITEKGCCGRVGSLVTDIEIAPTPRLQKEYCLYKHNGSCQKCVKRCVNDALKVDSFDRHKCYEMLLDNDRRYDDLGLTDVCGKCVVDLPCSRSNPVKKIK